ncbi:MAG: plastocyanin/azurin family copper-binding protein [Acidimicrobiales bacterium]
MHSLEAEAAEFAFSPGEWSVPSGNEIAVTFYNAGSIEHEWAVIKLGEDLITGDDFTEEKVFWEVEKRKPGVLVTKNFTWDTPGTYQIVCALDGHFDAGMVGSLTVS